MSTMTATPETGEFQNPSWIDAMTQLQCAELEAVDSAARFINDGELKLSQDLTYVRVLARQAFRAGYKTEKEGIEDPRVEILDYMKANYASSVEVFARSNLKRGWDRLKDSERHTTAVILAFDRGLFAQDTIGAARG